MRSKDFNDLPVGTQVLMAHRGKYTRDLIHVVTLEDDQRFRQLLGGNFVPSHDGEYRRFVGTKLITDRDKNWGERRAGRFYLHCRDVKAVWTPELETSMMAERAARIAEAEQEARRLAEQRKAAGSQLATDLELVKPLLADAGIDLPTYYGSSTRIFTVGDMAAVVRAASAK